MKPFVSLGPPSETLLLHGLGFRPLGAVVGVSVVAKGSANSQSGMNGAEIRVQTDAVATGLANARRRAIEQATALGASGIVGTRIEFLKVADAPDLLVEVRCVGTAVADGSSPTGTPFLSNLHGADLLSLAAAGYLPVGLAVGFCFYTQAAGYRTVNAQSASRGRLGQIASFEHPDFTDATRQARGIAMRRLQEEALAAGAEGVVGVEMEPEIALGVEGLRVSFVTIGTAVHRLRGAAIRPDVPPLAVPLR